MIKSMEQTVKPWWIWVKCMKIFHANHEFSVSLTLFQSLKVTQKTLVSLKYKKSKMNFFFKQRKCWTFSVFWMNFPPKMSLTVEAVKGKRRMRKERLYAWRELENISWLQKVLLNFFCNHRINALSLSLSSKFVFLRNW